jgi:hypothetical protein
VYDLFPSAPHEEAKNG